MNSLITRGSLLDDFFRDVSPSFLIKPLHGDPLPSPEQIKMDVKENDNSFTVCAEIPGVSREDIHVTIEGNVLLVRAEIKQEDAHKDDKSLRHERYFGAVSRGIQLPQDIDQAASNAAYVNGVLTLTLPKRQGKTVKELQIH